MKKSLAEVITLKASLKSTIDDVAARLSGEDEWHESDFTEMLEREIRETVDLNDFASDIARTIVKDETNKRAVVAPKNSDGQLELGGVESKFFSDDALYKLGNGVRVNTKRATMYHGLKHQGSLSKAASDTSASAERHNEFLVLCSPYMQDDPTMTLYQAWQKYLLENPPEA